MSITIDSTTYDVPIISMKRKGDSLYKYAERTADGELHSEMIGVYYNYDLVFGCSINNISDYDDLWDKLTEPSESFEITLVDESEGTLTFDCYFANPQDEPIRYHDGVWYFRGLSVSVIAISPARTPS